MARSLAEAMDFDHVVTVAPDGTVLDGPDLLTPELFVDSDGTEIFMPGDEPWELLRGYSGQHGYSGPVNHSSEVIGGGLERDILARPGYYVAIVARTDDDPAGWAVAFHPAWFSH